MHPRSLDGKAAARVRIRLSAPCNATCRVLPDAASSCFEGYRPRKTVARRAGCLDPIGPGSGRAKAPQGRRDAGGQPPREDVRTSRRTVNSMITLQHRPLCPVQSWTGQEESRRCPSQAGRAKAMGSARAPGPGPTFAAAPPRTGRDGSAANGRVSVASRTGKYPGNHAAAASPRQRARAGSQNQKARGGPRSPRGRSVNRPCRIRLRVTRTSSQPGAWPKPPVPTRAGLRLQMRQRSGAGIVLVCACEGTGERQGQTVN
jgi:hypothetical protein